MTQKERLFDLIQCYSPTFDDLAEDMADFLIGCGVIVPPCKVGGVVYSIGKLDGKVHRETVQYFNYDSEDQQFWFGTDGPGVFTSEHIGKWVFFTREAAEQALRERDKKNELD